ncbi:MAG TPA: hypothetical protein VEV63_02575 [Streptosporangiaceae bacterium]|nr:hypothetical protein [Streptosporangiaceae bacterium]
MLLAWLLPDSSYTVLRDGWSRPSYRPRHCRPPLVLRAWQAMSGILIVARDRYLGIGEEDAMTTAPRPVS